MSLSNPNIELTEAQESDRQFFVYVHHTAYRFVIEEMFGWDDELQHNYANAAFDSDNIYLIMLNGEKVGVVGVDILPDHVWLKQLFILPDRQRRGVGSFVVNWATETARQAGKDLRLQTLKANIGALRFYQTLGFELNEESDRHWKLSLRVDPTSRAR